MKKIPKKEISGKSLSILAEKLVTSVSDLLKSSKNEEELKIGFEKVLAPILEELSISSSPKYERTIITGRPDAVHGQVIIEYEHPYAFRKKQGIETAYGQLLDYIEGETKKTKETLFLFAPKFIGVGFDGEQIFFVRFKGEKDKAKFKFSKKDFTKIGPYSFSPQSARTLLIHLRGLSRLPLNAENLTERFGPRSKLAPKAVSAFANALEHWANERVKTFFSEWKRLFGIVYGEQFNNHQKEEVVALSELYGVGEETDFQELLFSIHTYFAFLMKLIAAELLVLKETALSSSFASELTHSSADELKNKLIDIEEGGVYARKGITNFLEGDFFRWYLDTWSPELVEVIQDITRSLSEFEPATTTLDPEETRDLLKKLYQYLVPQEVRHRLGEYYTPDWLAELILDEVGYYGNTLKKLIDPACGSGTFLVLAIQRAKEHSQKEGYPVLKTTRRIVHNIWGFDLNPLAVIAARTNYLFALGELVNELERLEIPIYLTDSVLTPTRTSGNLFGEFLEVSTSVGKFRVPAEWIKDGGFLLSKAAPLVEEMTKNQYSVDEAMKKFNKEGLVFPSNKEVVSNFYRQILELEKQNKNGIWARFLKNAFAPTVAGKFDFVVGNPPWIRWDYISKEYREATLNLWKDYGLFSLKGFQARLGGGKKDFSMLFVYASADYYLKDRAKLGFLITQEVFKSKGAGEGFRRFQIGDKEYLKVMKSHDLVSIKPFEGAANKTAAIILRKGEKTEYPISYTVWDKKKNVGRIPTDIMLKKAMPLLEKRKLSAQPLGSKVGPWQTVPIGKEWLSKIEDRNFYKAILGANLNPYGVFWLKIKQVLSNRDLLISNLTEKGKKDIEPVERRIESDLVYPIVRGSDIDRWKVNPKIYGLIVQDPKTRVGYLEEIMKQKWQRTYGYLAQFKRNLESRALYKKYHADAKNPFYSQFNISEETFARYKVIWKRMTNDLIATVVSQCKTPFGYKKIVPLETTSLIATNNEDEAHFLCAVINSMPVRDFVKSFSSAGRGFGTPSVMKHVGIPKFDPKNKLHQRLAEISKKCHQFKTEGKEREIEKLAKENNALVKKLFGIK